MTTSSIIDDVANGTLLQRVLARAAERELSIDWLRELACGHASASDRELYAEHWTATLIDYLQRGRVGELQRRGGRPGRIQVLEGLADEC